MFVHVTDRTDAARDAIVNEDTAAPLIGGWLAADGAADDEPSLNVRALERALRAADWPRVHAIAEHLSFDISAAI